MSKRRRNTLIVVGLLLLFLCGGSFGIRSPFDADVLSQVDIGAIRSRLFGGDNTVALNEIDTDCREGRTLSFDDDCSLSIEGTDEDVRVDTPRDLRLTQCWGEVSLSSENSEDKLNITVAALPTSRHANALTVNVFQEGDTDVDLQCNTPDCRIALNAESASDACPSQTQVRLRDIDRGSGCTLDVADSELRVNTTCTLTMSTRAETTNSDGDDIENPAALDRDARPRQLRVTHCEGDLRLSVDSAEELQGMYEVVEEDEDGDDEVVERQYPPVEMPGQRTGYDVDVYGDDVTDVGITCTGEATCVLRLRERTCLADES